MHTSNARSTALIWMLFFWMGMIAVTLLIFSLPFSRLPPALKKVDCTAISKVWTTGMLEAAEGLQDKRAGAPTSSKVNLALYPAGADLACQKGALFFNCMQCAKYFEVYFLSMGKRIKA